MDFRKRYLLIIGVAIALLVMAMVPQGRRVDGPESDLAYEIRAGEARLNRRVMGEVTASVQGIPAEPVHSFVWDGNGSVPLERSSAKVEIDPISNTGEIKAEWTDPDGNEWSLTQTVFLPLPPHPLGLRAVSLEETEFVEDDPVPVDVYLHGDTTAGGPVLPTIFNNMATWGPAEVTLNGEPFLNPYDGPTPNWVTHTMLTAGVRNEDGTVTVNDGTIYNPSLQDQPGDIDYDDMEYHIVFHDAPGPENTENFPPPLSFFYHLTFESVKVEISAGQ